MAELAKGVMRSAVVTGHVTGDPAAAQRFAGLPVTGPDANGLTVTPAAPLVVAPNRSADESDEERRARLAAVGTNTILGGSAGSIGLSDDRGGI